MKYVPTLYAVYFLETLKRGRTKPGVYTCEDSSGTIKDEYVIKLRGSIENGNAGLLFELIGNLLASKLGITVPNPSIIEIQDEFVKSVSNLEVSKSLKNSIGKNFGSKNLKEVYATWLIDKSIQESIKQAATDIFVFDALI